MDARQKHSGMTRSFAITSRVNRNISGVIDMDEQTLQVLQLPQE
jgi:hypothetical protein